MRARTKGLHVARTFCIGWPRHGLWSTPRAFSLSAFNIKNRYLRLDGGRDGSCGCRLEAVGLLPVAPLAYTQAYACSPGRVTTHALSSLSAHTHTRALPAHMHMHVHVHVCSKAWPTCHTRIAPTFFLSRALYHLLLLRC